MDSSEQLLWSVQVDHQLFALQKLDVTVSLYGGLNYYFNVFFIILSIKYFKMSFVNSSR